MKLEISSIVVLVREYGMDKVIIHTTNLPPTVYPYDQPGSLLMDVAKGDGEQYVKDNFNLIPKVIEC